MSVPELNGKNVLVTGALGTIGQALVARYAEEGANVIALDRPDAPNPAEGAGRDRRGRAVLRV